MPLATERISLNNFENGAIRSGLDRIVNGFAELLFTKCRSLDILDTRLKTKLQPRFLADGMYELIVSLRIRLARVAQQNRSKHRFTVTEYAVLAFAVRVGRKIQKEDTKKLERKLEVFRKRAKRRTIARIGQPAYKAETHNWLCSSRWIRVHIMPMRLAGHRFGEMATYREQYGAFMRLAKDSLTERCTELPSDELLSKLVKLALAEIRRRRHSGIKVRELIADPAQGKQFLFEFVRKRIERRGLALHLKVEFQPNCVQMAIRAEKFKAAMVVQDSTPPIKTDELEPAVVADSRMHVERARLGSLDDAIVTPASVADWLIKYVEPEYWDDVVAEAKNQLDSNVSTKLKSFADTGIDTIQQACRPVTEPSDALEYINFMVDWFLAWTLPFENDIRRINLLLSEGLAQARASYKPLDNGPYRIDRVRYIAGIIDGTLRA